MATTQPTAESMTPEQAINFLYQRNEQLTKQVEDLLQQRNAPVPSAIKRYGLKPPQPDVFKGQSVDLFIFAIEKSFEFYKVDEGQKVSLAITYFRESALRWYQFVEQQRKGSPMTWQEFKVLMVQHFKASNTGAVIRNKLNSLRQLNSVATYNDLFNKLIIELPEVDVDTKIDMYRRGLKTDIHVQVCLSNPRTLEANQTVALNIDNVLSAARFQRRNGQSFQGGFNPNSRYASSQAQSSGSSAVPMELGFTDLEDASEAASTSLNAMKSSSGYQGKRRLDPELYKKYREAGKCFKCGQTGHISKNCNRKNA